MFRPVSADLEFVAIEEAELARWKANNVFERSMKLREGAEPWVFYEGPPTANGMPGLHHVWARVYKDLFCRYQRCGSLRAPSSWLGHPRASGRSPGRKADRASRERRRSKSESASPSSRGSVASRCSTLHRGVRTAHRAHWLLDGHGARVLHVPRDLHRVGVVAPEAAVRARTALRGLQGRSLLPALRDGTLVARTRPARASTPTRSTRAPTCDCASPTPTGARISAARRTWRCGRRRRGP